MSPGKKISEWKSSFFLALTDMGFEFSQWEQAGLCAKAGTTWSRFQITNGLSISFGLISLLKSFLFSADSRRSCREGFQMASDANRPSSWNPWVHCIGAFWIVRIFAWYIYCRGAWFVRTSQGRKSSNSSSLRTRRETQASCFGTGKRGGEGRTRQATMVRCAKKSSIGFANGEYQIRSFETRQLRCSVTYVEVTPAWMSGHTCACNKSLLFGNLPDLP